MNITAKIIVTDTNIITDLYVCNLLEKFINLDNVYVCSLVKNDELNSKTCNINFIDEIKTIDETTEEILEASELSNQKGKLSLYDFLNYVVARDNNSVLATGDDRLKKYSENNNVEVIRTLKIIKLMKENNIISVKKAIDAVNKLKYNPQTRIPLIELDKFSEELEKDLVAN